MGVYNQNRCGDERVNTLYYFYPLILLLTKLVAMTKPRVQKFTAGNGRTVHIITLWAILVMVCDKFVVSTAGAFHSCYTLQIITCSVTYHLH